MDWDSFFFIGVLFLTGIILVGLGGIAMIYSFQEFRNKKKEDKSIKFNKEKYEKLYNKNRNEQKKRKLEELNDAEKLLHSLLKEALDNKDKEEFKYFLHFVSVEIEKISSLNLMLSCLLASIKDAKNYDNLIDRINKKLEEIKGYKK